MTGFETYYAEIPGTRLAILYAERDMFKEDHFLKMGELIPGLQLKKILGASHISIFFKKETRDFLEAFLGVEDGKD